MYEAAPRGTEEQQVDLRACVCGQVINMGGKLFAIVPVGEESSSLYPLDSRFPPSHLL